MSTSISEQVECVRREIRMRKQVYPRRVAAGQMQQADADRELACMQDVLETLGKVARSKKFELV